MAPEDGISSMPKLEPLQNGEHFHNDVGPVLPDCDAPSSSHSPILDANVADNECAALLALLLERDHDSLKTDAMMLEPSQSVKHERRKST